MFEPQDVGLCDNCGKHPVPVNPDGICRTCYEAGITNTHKSRNKPNAEEQATIDCHKSNR